MPLHAEQSPDESVNATQGAHVNVNRFTIPKDPWSLITAAALALSICVNLALLIMYRYDAQERDLDRYDFGQFMQKDFAPLKAKVDSQELLIQAYGLRAAVKGK